MEKENLIGLQDLVENSATRLPICLCIDNSGSMGAVIGGEYTSTGKTIYEDGKNWNVVKGGVTRLSELERGLNLFFQAIKDDIQAKYAAEINIVKFNDDVECIVGFASIEHQNVPKLEAKGDTHMGEALNLSLDLLEERKNAYKDKGIDYYQPWLVIITDGENNGKKEELQKAIERINSLVNNKKLTIFPIYLGDEVNINEFRKISPKRAPLKLNELKFAEFFEWLSKSVSRTSQSVVGEKVTLDTTAINDWAEL